MKKLVLPVSLVVMLAGCSGGAPGYLQTDVLEPENLNAPVASGVKIQGEIMTDGTLTYQGSGEVQKAYLEYVEAMRGLGWEPRSSDGDAATGMQSVLRKDTRQLELAVTAAGTGEIKVVIKVGPGK